ncbi:MAG: hypothetical protein AB7S74_18395 [Hyphomicrobium sp.]
MINAMRSPGRLGMGAARDHVASFAAVVTVVTLGAAFSLSTSTQFLMPGPLSSVHGAIEECSACHTKSGTGKLKWLQGLLPRTHRADSDACLSCHNISKTSAFNAHGARADMLKKSSERLAPLALTSPAPQAARAQDVAFPVNKLVESGLACATCHQEHQGTNFNVAGMTNEQCRSCHLIKFDSFAGTHPRFESYPFRRRTRIVYDHTAHFDKHFPEVAKKEPTRRIPATCASCHQSSDDKKVMTVMPFEQTCAGCHLDQITGKERVNGPKGIAFLSLPGLDLNTLQAKGAAIGEWPADSDAPFTPFMKVMLSASPKGRDLVKSVENINLQDLSSATATQIASVASLAREIKSLLYALITTKPATVLAGAKPDADRISDLIAALPRDVAIAAQRQWLPNLAAEMKNGPGARLPEETAVSADPAATQIEQAAAKTQTPERSRPDDPKNPPEEEDAPEDAKEKATAPRGNPQTCLVRMLGQCVISKGPSGGEAPTADQSESNASESRPKKPKRTSSANKLPAAMRAGLGDVPPTAQAATQSSRERPTGTQKDELLNPTQEEQREINAHRKGNRPREAPSAALVGEQASRRGGTASSSPAPLDDIETSLDAESWAERGGWYRQDYTIFYRPTGHKDRFIASWLLLTAPQTQTRSVNPSASVFNALTGKDAQGACTKCHSIDVAPGKGVTVNFAPISSADKHGRFTRFIHDPHLSQPGDRGCFTCHELAKDRPYLKSYEQPDPLKFVAAFDPVKKDTCQGCHSAGKAREDCLLCHAYHIDGVATRIRDTKLPVR